MDFPLRKLLVGVQWGALSAVVLVVAAAVASIWLPAEVRDALTPWGGPFGALVAVTVAAATARRDAAISARQAHDEQAEREIQQARLVAVDYSWSGWDDPEHKNDYDLTVTITNHSDALVVEPRLIGFIHPQSGGEINWDVVDDVPGLGEYPGPASVVRADVTEALLVEITCRPELAPGTGGKLRAVIAFTDAAGRRWRRVGSDLPVRVRADATRSRVEADAALTFPASGPDWYRIDS